MIFNIPFKMIENVNDDLQISVALGTEPGQRIVTETLEEKPRDRDGNHLFSVHPTKPWLITSSDNYFIMQGTLKVWFKWKDGDPFQSENIQDYLDFQNNLVPNYTTMTNHQEDSDNKIMSGQYTYLPTETSGFVEPLVKWRPYTSEGGIEIIDRDTVFVCPMQYSSGWTFQSADLMNNDSMTVDREGLQCYVLPGQLLHTEDNKRVEKYKLTKLESSSVKLFNRSGTFCKIAKMFK